MVNRPYLLDLQPTLLNPPNCCFGTFISDLLFWWKISRGRRFLGYEAYVEVPRRCIEFVLQNYVLIRAHCWGLPADHEPVLRSLSLSKLPS